MITAPRLFCRSQHDQRTIGNSKHQPALRDTLKFRRCLIPAVAFYEWVRTGKTRQPYCFEVNDGELFAFAGIWGRWKDASGKTLETCSILTTDVDRQHLRDG